MRAQQWVRWTITTLALAAVAAPAAAQRTAVPRDRDGYYEGRDHDDRIESREAYQSGYRDGLRDGENDARHSRPFEIRNTGRLKHDDVFRRGYEQGYRESYERSRVVIVPPASRPGGGVFNRRLPRGYEEPAFARGYSDGYREGADDGHDRDRYDPVRNGKYRDGDNGYYREYGSKDAYKYNYRTGFRQGYEDGYRDGANGRR
jgi:flagellar biosynthesis/type III secretory pathway protein FliH